MVPLHADECAQWASQCKDVQKFRSSRAPVAVEATQADICTNCASRGNPLLKEISFAKNMVGTGNFDASKFSQCLATEQTLLERAQHDDVDAIVGELGRLGIVKVGLDEIDSLLLKPQSSYGRLKARISDQPTNYPWYRDYALSGPFQNLEESYVGTKKGLAEVVIKKYDRSARDILAQQPDGRRIVSFLVDRARKIGTEDVKDFAISPNPDRAALTPAMAKLMLYELIRDKLSDRPRELGAFLSKLKLKFDYADPSAKLVGNPDTVTVHNGYYLGANPDNYLSNSDHSASTGYDCTAIIQKCQGQAGLSFPPNFKLLSSRLASMNSPDKDSEYPEMADYRAIYRAEKYKCEAQLKPGDVVAFNGHAFVFSGYRSDAKGALQASTFEAIAGEYRSYGTFLRQFYSGDACAPAKFSSGGETNAMIIRVTR